MISVFRFKVSETPEESEKERKTDTLQNRDR